MGRATVAPNVETAVRIYSEYSELENEHIRELFNYNISTTTIGSLKNRAREQMVEDGTKTFSRTAVDTDSAFKAWNLDVKLLEAKYKRLMRLRGEKE